MRRRVFEQVEVDGLESNHVESLSLQVGSSQPSRLYAGTTDGQLTAYDCLSRRSSYELAVVEVLRSGSNRERKAISQVEYLDSVVVALVDGLPTVYDSQTLRTTATARDVRGCQLFCAHVASRTLVCFSKKRARVYGWHRGGALRDTRREYSLAESATAACCVTDKLVVLATRREYQALRLTVSELSGGAASGGPAMPSGLFQKTVGSALSSLSGAKSDTVPTFPNSSDTFPHANESATRRLCDAPGGAGVAVVVAGSQSRPNSQRLLTSSGARGVLFDASSLSSALEERLSWSGSPSASVAASAFIVSLVGAKRFEVHFAPSLALVQTIDLDFRVAALCGVRSERGATMIESTGGDFSSAHSTAAAAVMEEEEGDEAPTELFVAGDSAAKCRCLRMVPARQQIAALVDDADYEDALALCAARDVKRGRDMVDVAAIEERYAYALYSRGDFEGAVQHWLAADPPPGDVAALFPALCPPGMQHALATARAEEDDASPEKRDAMRHPPQLRQASLSRAAAAVTRFLEETRSRVLAAASSRGRQNHQMPQAGRQAVSRRMAGASRRQSADDAQLEDTLKLVDTVLVSARLNCSPPRVGDVVELLKSPDQHCELESVAPLLAAGGPAYAEPLLWLYRSKGQHSRALSMLVEERCCGPPPNTAALSAGGPAAEGTWDRARFRRWKSRYLRSLWFSGDPRLAALALDAAGSLFDVAPRLGLAVFTGAKVELIPSERDDEHANLIRQQNRGATGGAGTPAQDVVAWMKKLTFPSDQSSIGTDDAFTANSTPNDLPMLVLDSGNAVAIAYLEFLVEKGERLQLLHNELAYLLLDGLLKARAGDALLGAREEAYRARLRRLLKSSMRYRAETVLSWLPQDLPRERALVLARLGRHDDVLAVYADELRDDTLAEAYCAEVWEAADTARVRRLAKRERQTDSELHRQVDDTDNDVELSPDIVAEATADNYGGDDDDDALGVYLCLARRYVGRGSESGLEKAMSIISRNVRRVDPVAALELLPESVSFARVADFAARLYRLTESARRDAEVEHQILRVHYVDLKYELTQQQLRQQSKISAVPELARLGKLKRSLPPVVLLDANNAEPYDVTCVPHVFDGHVALQFRITNNAPGHRLQNVRVKVESLGDADLYAHDAEVPLKVLPFKSTGSCYVVFRTFPTVGTVVTSFANELRFAVLTDNNNRSSSGAASDPDFSHTSTSSYLEEIPLHNLELSTADM